MNTQHAQAPSFPASALSRGSPSACRNLRPNSSFLHKITAEAGSNQQEMKLEILNYRVSNIRNPFDDLPAESKTVTEDAA